MGKRKEKTEGEKRRERVGATATKTPAIGQPHVVPSNRG